jgi:hypothetical protein
MTGSDWVCRNCAVVGLGTRRFRCIKGGFEYLSGYIEFWLRLIGVRSVVSLTVEHSWDGRAVDMNGHP